MSRTLATSRTQQRSRQTWLSATALGASITGGCGSVRRGKGGAGVAQGGGGSAWLISHDGKWVVQLLSQEEMERTKYADDLTCDIKTSRFSSTAVNTSPPPMLS